jgi:uncharacterized protein YndB with AHSA1/START domain
MRDRVERDIVIRAPRARVFAALTDASLYPTWGPERVEGDLAPGEKPILDFGPAGGGKVRVHVVTVEPPRYFAFRWAQGETDPARLLLDPLAGPNTLVEFFVDDVDGASRVRVVESGVASLPAMAGVDPDKAAEGMEQGWQLMLGALARALGPRAPADPDRVAAELVVPAPPERVFAALRSPEGWWAQRVEGELAPGEVPLLDFGPFGTMRFFVVAVEPPERLAFRRVQGSDDPDVLTGDPRQHPSTEVELRLDATPGGTRVRVEERGFAALPGGAPAHRERADRGWPIVLGLLAHHLEAG